MHFFSFLFLLFCFIKRDGIHKKVELFLNSYKLVTDCLLFYLSMQVFVTLYAACNDNNSATRTRLRHVIAKLRKNKKVIVDIKIECYR